MRTWWVLAALAAGCASGAGVREVPAERLSVRLDREVARSGAVPWSDEPLSWDDFAAAAPARPGGRGAETVYTIFHAAQCTGVRFEFRVIAGMLPHRSWVAADVRAAPALAMRTLRHEQTHFDLVEVHARRLRRHFAELYDPCRRSTVELDALAARFMREEAEAQQRYDAETSHGRLDGPQRAWDADVARQLLVLDAYSDQARSTTSGPFRMRPEK